MCIKSKRLTIMAAMAIFFFSQTPLYAVSMSMDQVKDLFKKETGQDWTTASAEDRKEFLYNTIGRKKVEYRKERIKGEDAPYYIREGYYRDTGIEWDDADEDAQKIYIKEYEQKKKAEERAEEIRRKELERRNKSIAREIKMEERERQRRIKARQRAIKLEKKEEERKRKLEKKRLADAKKRMENLRKNSR